jgi:dipeptidyl aminopeptidase/acylaminoacyl peptidase
LSGDSLRAVWAPDGKSLVISATDKLHESAFSDTYFHLYQVFLSGGEPKPLTSGTDYSCHSAKFSPDNQSLLCRYTPATEFVYEQTELAHLGWPKTGTPKVLTGDFDRSVSDFDFVAGGKDIVMVANEHGRARLFSMSAKGGKVTPMDPDSRGVYAGVRSAGKSLIARWESSATPAEIVTINPRSGQHKALTSFNKERAAGLDRQAFREFWFESEKGRQIHSWLALPPNFDDRKKFPLVLMIHGGPHSSSRDADHVRWSPHLLAAPGYVVLLTDYTGSVGYGEKFAQNIQGDPLKTPGDELLQAVDEAIKRYDFIDEKQLAATGASYGGHLVNWLQATSKRFKTLVNHAGLASLEGQWSTSDVIYHRELNNGGPPWGNSPIWREQSPSTYADQWSTPMMLTIGEKDYRVPVNQTIASWSYLMRMQVPGKLLVFHDANHWVMKGAEARHYWSEVHEWLARYLSVPK